MEPDALFIDRAYVDSELTEEVKGAGGEVVSKPWFRRGHRRIDEQRRLSA